MITGSLARMQAAIDALGTNVPARASAVAATRLQTSLDTVSDAKGRAHTGTATATPDGVAISVHNSAPPYVSDAWRTIVLDAIDDSMKGGTK